MADGKIESARALALNSVNYLLSDDRRANGFLTFTGLGENDLRVGLNDDVFLVGVLEYLLTREDLLLEFCEQTDIEPTEPARAAACLDSVLKS